MSWDEGSALRVVEPVEPFHWEDALDVEGPKDRGLEVLVDLVKSGSVDPWDVDLRVVASRFLAAIDALTIEDLPSSGRLLFFASVIIRLKAQWLAGRSADFLEAPVEDETYEGEAWDDYDDAWGDFADTLMPAGRAHRGAGEILLFPKDRLRKRRPLTIQDLLDALDKAEAHETKMERQRSRKSSDEVVPFQSVEEAMDTLHQDDFEWDVNTAHELVGKAFDTGEGFGMEVFVGHMDRVSAYLALLFLAARGDVTLEQEHFYQEILIQPGDPTAIEAYPDPRPRFVPKRRPRKPTPEALVVDAAAEVTTEFVPELVAETLKETP